MNKIDSHTLNKPAPPKIVPLSLHDALPISFGEERLVEEQVPPVGEARLFLVQAPYHGMRRIDLEDRLHLRPLLADGLENAREIAPHVVLVGYEARRRSGEARGNAHVLHAVAERLLQFRDERPVPA